MTLDGITGQPFKTDEAPIARGLYRNGDLALYDLRDPQPYFKPAIFAEVDYLTPMQVIDHYRSQMTARAHEAWQQVGQAVIPASPSARMAA